MSTDLQTVSGVQNPSELGPFGRAFVGEFPTRGTLSIIALALLFDFVIAGGWISLLILAIITTYLSIYLCYNYIEPHFNSKVGVVRQKKLDQITSKEHMAMSDIGKLLHGYGKSAVGQVWDLSGKRSLRDVFEGVPADSSGEQRSIGASDKTWVSWLIIITFLIVWWLLTIIGTLALWLALYSIGMSDGLAFSIAALLIEIILIPLVLLYIYVDGSLERIREMLRFGSMKRTVILLLAIPIVVTIIDFILNIIYAIVWIGIIGEPSANTDLGTDWESSSIDIAFLILSVAIVTPIAEELFFRGYLLDAINRKHGDWTAIILSSILFGLVHIDPFVVGSAFMGGIIYGWIRMRTGSLLPSIACHMMWNMLALVLTYL